MNYSDIIPNQRLQVKAVMNITTHQEIYDELSRHVYGQNNAKRALSMLAYHHLNGHPSSLLIGGIGFGAEMRKVHDYNNTTITSEDFIKAGIRRENMGRINDVTYLTPMSADDFRHILDTPELSPIDRIAAEYHINLMVSDALKDELAQQAYDSKLGCRAIYSEIKRRLNVMMFTDCNLPYYHLDTSAPTPAIIARSEVPAYTYTGE